MSPSLANIPVIIRTVRRITAVGLAASTAAPTGGAAAALIEARPWTAYPVQLTEAPPLRSTTGPMRFSDALDDRGLVVGLGSAGVASAESVKTIYERSGLTWEQLAKLFGVSRRAVHSWASGSRVSARHVEAIFELAGRLSQRTSDPDENRAWLLDSSAGPSVYEQIRLTNARSPMEARLTPRELMGIG